MGRCPSLSRNSRSIWRCEIPATGRERGSVERILALLFHGGNDLQQPAILDSVTRGDRQRAWLGCSMDRKCTSWSATATARGLPSSRPDPIEHHVDGCGAAGRSHAVPVGHVQRLLGENLRVALPKARQAFPVAGGAIAVEDAGFGQQEGACIDGGQRHPAPRQFADRHQHGARQSPLRLVARRDNGHGGPTEIRKAARHRDRKCRSTPTRGRRPPKRSAS